MKEKGRSHSAAGVLIVSLVIMTLVSSAGRVHGADLSKYYKSPQMADAPNYVRLHKGQGLKRAVMGSEAELMDSAVKSLQGTNVYTITREPHVLFLETTETGTLAYALYFYPSQTARQTEVEVLIASPWFDAETISKYQADAFSSFFFSNYIKTRLQEKEYDPNSKEGSLLVLTHAAFNENIEIADALIKRGAKVDLAVAELKEIASKNKPYLDKPANKQAYDRAYAAVKLLESGVGTVLQARREEAEKDAKAFQAVVRTYQKSSVKPKLPEEARRFKIQAEGAVRDKDLSGAGEFYSQALAIAPWWPEGHFNRALVLGETKDFESAIKEMQRYLALVPKASNARAAQDQIYDWERKVKK